MSDDTRTIAEIIGWNPPVTATGVWWSSEGAEVRFGSPSVDDMLAWLMAMGYGWVAEDSYQGGVIFSAWVDGGSNADAREPTLHAAVAAAVRAVAGGTVGSTETPEGRA